MLYNMHTMFKLHMLFCGRELFYFKLDQPKYSIAPGDYGKLQLSHCNKSHKTLLNEFFFYVFFQGFFLIEHEGYPRDFLGRTHGGLAALKLGRTAIMIVQIWPYARSSSGIKEHDCQPHFLALCHHGIG